MTDLRRSKTNFSIAERAAFDKQITEAIQAGDTGRVRQLIAEKKSIEAAQERETQRTLAEFRSREKAQEIAPPKKDEESLLARRAKRLKSEIARKQAQREKLLARLERDPEDEKLLDQIDSQAKSCERDGERLRAILARQDELERWEAAGEREQERAAKRREFDKKAPKLRARLESVVSEMLDAWKAIEAGLPEIDQLLAELDDPEMRAPHLAGKVYQRINDATAGGVTYDAVGWKISSVRRRK